MTPQLRAIFEAIPTVGEIATRRALGRFLASLEDTESIAQVIGEPAADGDWVCAPLRGPPQLPPADKGSPRVWRIGQRGRRGGQPAPSSCRRARQL